MASHINDFKIDTTFLYGIDDTSDTSEYLSDAACSDATKINLAAAWRLNDKAIQGLVFRPFKAHLVTTFGYGDSGIWRTVDSDKPLDDVIVENEILVCKPRYGASGREVEIIKTQNWDRIELAERIHNHSLVVTEWAQQSAYAHDIWPYTAGTVRVLTMRPEGEPPFIAAAVHRFGSKWTAYVDNWNQGGFSAAIDREGRLSRAARQRSGSPVEWHSYHPDTGIGILDVLVPKWDGIRFLALDMAEWLAEIPYVGWDFVVTDERVVLIEANADPGVHCLQVHGGLLKSARVRRFYEEHGVEGL